MQSFNFLKNEQKISNVRNYFSNTRKQEKLVKKSQK